MTPAPIAITLPIRTRSETNMREHWHSRHSRRAGQREPVVLALRGPVNASGWAMALSAQAPPKTRSRANLEPARAIAVVVLTRISPLGLDDDNLRGAMKATRDAVAEVLGVDDRDARVLWQYAQAKGAVREHAVRIAIAAPQSCPQCGNVTQSQGF